MPEPIEDHLAAAQAAFASGDTSAADKAAADKAAADKAAADKAAADKSGDTSTSFSSTLSSIVSGAAPAKDDEDDKAGDKAAEDLADTQDIDDLEGPDEGSSSFNGWKDLKAKAKQDRQRLHESTKRLAELEEQVRNGTADDNANEASEARIKELETQNEELSSRLKSTDLKSHPDFEKEFLKPQRDARSKIEKLLTEEEIEGFDLDELLSLRGRKFNQGIGDLADQLTPLSRVKLVNHIDAIVDARDRAAEAEKSSSDFLSKAAERSTASRRQAFDASSKKLAGSFLESSPGDDASDEEKAKAQEYNTALKAISTNAERLAFGDVRDTDVADMAHKASMYDFVMSQAIPRIASMADAQIAELSGKIKEHEAELKRLTGNRPDLGSGGGGGGSDDPPDDHLAAAKQINFG